MSRGASIVVAAALLLSSLPARADDADLIPEGVIEAAPTPSAAPAPPVREAGAAFDGHFRLENAFSAAAFDEGVIVPFPRSLAVHWQDRTSGDARAAWRPTPSFAFTLSDRLSVIVEEQQPIASKGTLHNDFREGYLTWQPGGGFFVEAGRVNVRHGTALGFNPTDFFKTRSLVGQSSLDPAVIRENRLGTGMLQTLAIWRGGSASVTFAPKLTEPSPLASTALGVAPHFGATNGGTRMLDTLSFDLFGLNPELLAYFEQGRSKLGVSLSHELGAAVVAYAEWAGGREQTLIARAIAFGQTTGTLPPNAPMLPPTSTAKRFQSDLALGFSWTFATTFTLNAEYHLHQAGFSRADFRRWFELGGAPRAPAALTNELWYVRGYASDQQEPLTRHQLFLRAAWPRALVNELELTAFTFIDLFDGSMLGQVSADYDVSSRLTAFVYVSSNLGGARSERGSHPERVTGTFELAHYW